MAMFDARFFVSRHRGRSWPTMAAVITALVSAAGPAHADAAKSLFEEAKKLEAAGKVEEACAKLAESDHLDPQLAVGQARARCEKRAGRNGAALAAWREVAARAAAAKDAAAIQAALKEVAAIEKAMPKLTVAVDPGTAALDGAAVSIDGQPLAREKWGTPVAVDAGKHKVEAVARNRKRFSVVIDVAAQGEASATVPLLEDASVAKAIQVKAPTTVTSVSGARWHPGFGFLIPAPPADDATASSAGGASGPGSAPEPDRVPPIASLYSSRFDVGLSAGANLYESGLPQHGAVAGELTAAEAGAMLRYTHENVGWPVVPWAAVHGSAGLPVGEATGMSTILGGGARIGADWSPVHWFAVGPLLGYRLMHFSPDDGDGATQSGPELGLSTHFRTMTRKLDANVYLLNRWAGATSAVYAGLNAVLARPFLVYGEYRLARSGTVSAPGQTVQAFADSLPASARFGIGLEL